ncbi:MAG: ParA family protein [Elusimicrobia bacterium]|nr:ParA family protein [Elusimicrobiota bacterium]
MKTPPAEILVIANQKGGVGKTTTAINLAGALACFGQETLLVDIDPQGNATSGYGFDKSEIEIGTYQALLDSVPVEKTIKASPMELLDIMPSGKDMISAELDLADEFSRENRLRDALGPLRSLYRFILIDCPPSLGLLTINGLTAADRVIIPLQGEYYALEGLASFVETVERVKSTVNSSLEIEGGVLTMFDPRISLAQQVREQLSNFFGDKLFKTSIPRSIRLAEAPSHGKSILQYDPRSKGGQAYLALAGELLGRRGWEVVKID